MLHRCGNAENKNARACDVGQRGDVPGEGRYRLICAAGHTAAIRALVQLAGACGVDWCAVARHHVSGQSAGCCRAVEPAMLSGTAPVGGVLVQLGAPVTWAGEPSPHATSQVGLPIVAASSARVWLGQAQHQWGTSVGAIGGAYDVGWRTGAMCHVSGRSADCCHIVGPRVVGALVKTLACCDCRTSCRPEDSGENEQGVAEDRMRRQFPPRRRARRSHSLPSSSRGSPPLLLRRQTTRGAVTTMGAPPPTTMGPTASQTWRGGGRATIHHSPAAKRRRSPPRLPRRWQRWTRWRAPVTWTSKATPVATSREAPPQVALLVDATSPVLLRWQAHRRGKW